MRVTSYHNSNLDHWQGQTEFRRWCILNGVKAKWKSGENYTRNGKKIRAHNWEIENEEHAILATLAWS